MALSAGDRVGPYEILGPIGAGGMGEVYRALDTSLDREVAIKALPGDVAQNPERLSRFRREAKLLASLNHPNVAAIHGLEEASGQLFLVLELVEGEDLRERLGRGPLPVDESLLVARQIAEALEAAHGQGIVHRDLKPANVKLTPDGKVKVLDFGLAKAYGGAGEASPEDLSQSPTETQGPTAAGVILGTAAYMSPEQARGRAVDKRSDIWSFGAVLFEMLTGRGLFHGETVSDTLAAVLEREVDWTRLPPATPPAVRRVLRRCLQRDRSRRLHDIADARIEIEEALSGTAETSSEVPIGPVESSAWRRRLPWALAFVTGAVALGLAALHFTEEPDRGAPVYFVLDTSGKPSLDEIDSLAVSPDGRHIVLAARTGEEPRQLWLRSLETPEMRPLAGTEEARQPFWSPDGQWVGFFTESTVEKVSLSGGAVQRICRLPPGESSRVAGTWGEGGTILFSHPHINARIHAVPAVGGEARVLADLDASRGEIHHRLPQFLPGGQHLLLEVGHSDARYAIFAASLAAPEERRPVLEGVYHYSYAPSGHLVFVRQGTLLAQRIDADRLEPRGAAVPVSPKEASWTNGPGQGWFSTSANGVAAWLAEAVVESQLAWVDRTGTLVQAVTDPGPYRQLALSPDGRRVAVEVSSGGGRRELRVIDVGRGVSSRVTAGGWNEVNPVWSPDGRELVFNSWGEDGQASIVRVRPGEGEPASPLWESRERHTPESWSPHGPSLLYNAGWTEDERAVWAFPMDDSGREPALVLQKGFIVDEPTISPDGRWIAYVGFERPDLAATQVYVEPVGGTGRRVQVSPDGGGQPEWRADGGELFYVAPDRHVTVVDFREEGGEAVVGPPRALFRIEEYSPSQDRYGVTGDGQRFMVKVSARKARPPRVHVLLNPPSLLE